MNPLQAILKTEPGDQKPAPKAAAAEKPAKGTSSSNRMPAYPLACSRGTHRLAMLTSPAGWPAAMLIAHDVMLMQ